MSHGKPREVQPFSGDALGSGALTSYCPLHGLPPPPLLLKPSTGTVLS